MRRVVLVHWDDPAAPTERAADSLLTALRSLAETGFRAEPLLESGAALLARLRAAPPESFARSDYDTVFATLPRAQQEAVAARWGSPERDPLFRPGALDCGRFLIAALPLGEIVVALAPPRPADDPPPHGVLAFYAWIADGLRADAVVLPGRRADDPYRDAVLGAIPALGIDALARLVA